MSALQRRPLHSRPAPIQTPLITSPVKNLRTGVVKRGRSPDHGECASSHPVQKRLRPVSSAITLSPAHAARRDQKNTLKEQQRIEFREKYSRAFPSFVFYLDTENMAIETTSITVLEKRIRLLSATIDDFFSRQITHLITDQPIPVDASSEKENLLRGNYVSSRASVPLRSPIKLKARATDENGAGFDLVSKAMSFGIKVWNVNKLDSVLSRCLDTPLMQLNVLRPPSQFTTTRSLSRLLESERIHGTTERDPTQRRHDFRYFSKSSFFVLVEDIHQELATIAAYEYPPCKDKDDKKPPWPVLHCHPQSRGPFIPFDEREKRRWQRQQDAEFNQEDEHSRRRKRMLQAEAMKRKAAAHVQALKTGDLRRSVSMSNLRRRESFAFDQIGDLEDNVESANASGYLASNFGVGHVAASGNSVCITSTTGTTSTASYSLRNAQLPIALSGRMRQQVITSRKVTSAAAENNQFQQTGSVMGPPTALPERQLMIKKSRSTNTLRLPKREEGSKPGYCENCRQKFDDFKSHIRSRKHEKYAADDANFLQLDCLLARVKRRTVDEVLHEQRKREVMRERLCAGALTSDHDDNDVFDFCSL